MTKNTFVPKESAEQTALFAWARFQAGKRPELNMLFAIPNGGSRNAIEAKHLKAQGVKAGVPDICLPVARGKYHGLYIELKRKSGGRVSPFQEEWLERLSGNGYFAEVCLGFEDAAETILAYLDGGGQ